MDAGLAVEAMDHDAAVVGQRRQTGRRGGSAGLERSVRGEAVAGLLGLGKTKFGRAHDRDPVRLEQILELAQLARIVGRDQEPPAADHPRA
jgi:hypothetical protein